VLHRSLRSLDSLKAPSAGCRKQQGYNVSQQSTEVESDALTTTHSMPAFGVIICVCRVAALKKSQLK